MKRRQFLQTGGAALLSITTASQVWGALAQVDKSALASAQTILELEAVCDLVIPTTDTPGAKAVGVAPWLVLATEHQLEGSDRTTLPRFLTALNALGGAEAVSPSFAALSHTEQMKRLSSVDEAAFSQHSQSEIAQLWRTVKALILMGYYSSEVGAAEELRYKLVPGHFLPAVDITESENSNRAWSSDWIAVKL